MRFQDTVSWLFLFEPGFSESRWMILVTGICDVTRPMGSQITLTPLPPQQTVDIATHTFHSFQVEKQGFIQMSFPFPKPRTSAKGIFSTRHRRPKITVHDAKYAILARKQCRSAAARFANCAHHRSIHHAENLRVG